MPFDVKRVSLDDAPLVRAFVSAPRTVREGPYDLFLPSEGYWEHHLRLGARDAAFWVLFDRGEVVGRIGATLSNVRKDTGYVGFFEAARGGAEEISTPLFGAALEWLRGQGITQVFGPIDRSTWYGYRYRVATEPDAAGLREEGPFAWEPWQPPGYVEAFLREGFGVAEHFRSDGFRMGDAVEIVTPSAQRAEAQGFRMQPLGVWEEVLPELYPLVLQSFSANLLFEPIDQQEFFALYQDVGKRVDYSPSTRVTDQSGRTAAVSFAFMDRSHVVVKTLAAIPDFQRKGLIMALSAPMLERGRVLGATHFGGVLYRRGNGSEAAGRTRFSALLDWCHDYALFSRAL